MSTRGEPNTTDDTRALTIVQKGKLVDGQCQEAQLCARAAVSTMQAETEYLLINVKGGNNAGHLVRLVKRFLLIYIYIVCC